MQSLRVRELGSETEKNENKQEGVYYWRDHNFLTVTVDGSAMQDIFT